MGLKLGCIFKLTWPWTFLLREYLIYSDCALGLSWFQGCVAPLVLPILFSFLYSILSWKTLYLNGFFPFCWPKSATEKIGETCITHVWRNTTKLHCLDKIHQAKVLVILKAGSCIIFFYSLTWFLTDTTNLYSSTS